MAERREGPRFLIDSAGNVRDSRQTEYAPAPRFPSGPSGNGRDNRPGPQPPKRSGGAPYLIPIPIGLILWLVVTLLRGCGGSDTPPVGSQLPPDPSDLQQGKTAFFLGEYDAAITHLTAALNTYAYVGEVYHLRGLAYQARGQHEEALHDFELALVHGFRPAIVHNNRAVTYLAMGDYDKATADLDQAILIDPDLGKAYYNRALVESSRGDCDAAIADLDQALQHKASESSSMAFAALDKPGAGMFSERFRALQRELEFEETGADAPSVLYQRALCYEAKGLYDSALADLDQAVEALDKRLPAVTPRPADREPTPSGEVTEQENGPEDPRVDLTSVYYLRAGVNLEKGQYDQAAADLDKALELGFDPGVGQQLKALIDAWGLK